MRTRGLSAALLAALLAGCQARQPVPPPPMRPPAPEALAQPEPPNVYLQTSLAYELFISRLTDLALERSRTPATRSLATRMRADHQGLSAQFAFAARRLDQANYPIIGRLFEQRLRELGAAGDPDRTYVELMLVTHRELFTKHRAFARAGTSPTLRAVAAHALSVEQAHIAQLAAARR